MISRPSRFGLLTDKQLRVLALRDGAGMSFSSIARSMGTTRQDVSSTYRRAIANVEIARETLAAYTIATSSLLVVRKDTSLDEVVEKILKTADEEGIRLKWGRPELYLILRGLLRDKLDGSILKTSIVIAVRRDGCFEIFDPIFVEDILRAIGRSTPKKN